MARSIIDPARMGTETIFQLHFLFVSRLVHSTQPRKGLSKMTPGAEKYLFAENIFPPKNILRFFTKRYGNKSFQWNTNPSFNLETKQKSPTKKCNTDAVLQSLFKVFFSAVTHPNFFLKMCTIIKLSCHLVWSKCKLGGLLSE